MCHKYDCYCFESSFTDKYHETRNKKEQKPWRKGKKRVRISSIIILWGYLIKCCLACRERKMTVLTQLSECIINARFWEKWQLCFFFYYYFLFGSYVKMPMMWNGNVAKEDRECALLNLFYGYNLEKWFQQKKLSKCKIINN